MCVLDVRKGAHGTGPEEASEQNQIFSAEDRTGEGRGRGRHVGTENEWIHTHTLGNDRDPFWLNKVQMLVAGSLRLVLLITE